VVSGEVHWRFIVSQIDGFIQANCTWVTAAPVFATWGSCPERLSSLRDGDDGYRQGASKGGGEGKRDEERRGRRFLE